MTLLKPLKGKYYAHFTGNETEAWLTEEMDLGEQSHERNRPPDSQLWVLGTRL